MPFAMLTLEERGAVLKFLPAMDSCFLFENFSAWNPAHLLTGGLAHPGHDANICRPLRGATCGRWELGPGREAPPSMCRVPTGLSNGRAMLGRTFETPVSHWCLQMENMDPMTDLGPSGLVFRLDALAQPRRLAFLCRASARRPHRCGGVVALAGGLGNDKDPESVAVFMNVSSDTSDRHIFASRESSSRPVGFWEDDAWFAVTVDLDWVRRSMCIVVECETADGARVSSETLPFVDPRCKGVQFLLLYNLTRDIEVRWTDILLC